MRSVTVGAMAAESEATTFSATTLAAGTAQTSLRS